MQSTYHFSLAALQDSAISLLTAFICGTVIGVERQLRQRAAGLRTITLVTIGAALFVDIAGRIYDIYGGNQTPMHVVAYVVSGVGFLGAGVIMRDSGNVRGLNTAATLWTASAVGAAAGADLIAEAIVGTLFILGVNIVLRPLAAYLDRRTQSVNDKTRRLEEHKPPH